jgi:carboxylesterase
VPGVISDIKKPGVMELGYDRLPLQALYSATRFQRQLRTALPRLTQPLLLYRSAEDHVVPAASTAYVLRHAGSPDIEEIMLPNSYHVATLDNDAEEIFAGSLTFARRLSARPDSPGASNNGPVTPPESRLDTTHADG